MFGKFFSSAFTGSMIGCGSDIFAVWGYIIATTGPDSMVELNPTLIAVQIGMKESDVMKAIDFLMTPDPNSRTKKADGMRMIQHGRFLYEVVNHAQYRDIRDNVQRKEANKEYQRASRERKAVSQLVSTSSTMSAQEEVEVEADTEEEEINQQAWSDYVCHRKEIKKKITPLSETKQKNVLRGFSHDEQRRIVDSTVANGWTGLFPEKVKNETHNQRPESFSDKLARNKQRAGL